MKVRDYWRKCPVRLGLLTESGATWGVFGLAVGLACSFAAWWPLGLVELIVVLHIAWKGYRSE